MFLYLNIVDIIVAESHISYHRTFVKWYEFVYANQKVEACTIPVCINAGLGMHGFTCVQIDCAQPSDPKCSTFDCVGETAGHLTIDKCSDAAAISRDNANIIPDRTGGPSMRVIHYVLLDRILVAILTLKINRVPDYKIQTHLPQAHQIQAHLLKASIFHLIFLIQSHRIQAKRYKPNWSI